jgi:DNA-binding GntR family transcriptional regulator
MDTSTNSRPQTAQQAALSTLRRWLVSGRLTPGTRIGQEALAAELGLSVVPVREALKTLESEGQIIYKPRRGFFVAELSLDELFELCEIRSRLEGMAIDYGMDKLGDDDVSLMEELHRRMHAAADAGEMFELNQLDRQFHGVIFNKAAKPRLQQLIKTLWDQSDPYRAIFFGKEQHLVGMHADHELLIEAARARDAARMKEILDQHRLSPARTMGHLFTAGAER